MSSGRPDGTGPAEAVSEPAAELGCLLGETEPEQGVHRERGIPHPRVAVVPVPFAPELLGQPRRGRRDEGPSRCVGHQLQSDSGPSYGLPPASGVRRLGQPAAPEGDGVVEHLLELGLADLAWRSGSGALQHDAANLVRLQRQGQRDVAVRRRSRSDQPLVPRLANHVHGDGQVTVVEDHTGLGQLCLERREPVAGPGLQHDVEVHRPANTPHHPDQLVVPGGRPAGQRDHEVGDLADSVLGEEARDQNRSVRDVELLAGVVARGRADPELTAGVLVEQASEQAR